MSRPPISRENSSNNLALNQQGTNNPPEKDAKAAEQAAKSAPPQLSQKTEEKQPQPSGDTGFSKDDWTKHGQGSDDQPAQKQPKEKSSQDDQQKSSAKQVDTAPKGKAAARTTKVIIPSLKLTALPGGAPGTATLKSRPPVSPDSTSALGSHRAMSSPTGSATQANSSSSSSTPSANTQGLAPSSAPPARPLPLPPIPQTPSSQTPPVSTSNVPTSARSATSTPHKNGVLPGNQLSTASQKILDAALVHGNIDPAALGYLMVEVQTASFKSPTTPFVQGMPFLRAGLQVLNFTASNGRTYDSVNLIEQFLQPLAVKIFNTPECNELRKTMLKNYLPVASAVESAAKGMRPAEMQQSEKVKNLIDPVIKPVALWVCGENENLTSSQLPEVWKSLMLGMDLGVVHWLKKINCNDMKEVKNFRSEALIAFMSTRGYMMAWRDPITKYGTDHNFDAGKLNAYLNSYFTHRANKFINDVMLSRDDDKSDIFDSKIRGYLSVLDGQKELISKAPKQNASGRRELMKSRTLQSTKMPSSSSSSTVNDEATTLSPRIREKINVEKIREIKQEQNLLQRQKFFRGFSNLSNLWKISPEFFKAFQTHVINEMSDRAYEKFVQDPVQLCTRYLGKFYVGVLNKERQAAEKSIRAALSAIKSEDIKTLALKAEKVKSYVKPESEIALSPRGKNINEKFSVDQSSVQKNEISKERRNQFFGNLMFYTGCHEMDTNFHKSLNSYILGLTSNEYLKLEDDPVTFLLANIHKLYLSHISTTTKADRNAAAKLKDEFVGYLKSTPLESLKGLKDSMASPRINLEFPSNPFEEDEKQATIPPTTTASNFALQDSRIPSSSTVDVKPVQEKEVSGERKNKFLEDFISKTEINDIDVEFVASFRNYILSFTTADYLKFEADPINFCLLYIDKFYSTDIYTSTKKGIAIAAARKTELIWFLNNSRKMNPEVSTKLAASNLAPTSTASTSTSTASTQPPQDSRTLPVASVGVKPVATNVESEKTKSSSESSTEVGTESESDSGANDAASESTQES